MKEICVCEHGGDKTYIESIGLKIIDFSTNLNPYGPPESIFTEIKAAMDEIDVYPDSESRELRRTISERINRSEDEILVGAGVTELITLVSLAFIEDRVLIPRHTYGEYAVASKIMGAEICYLDMPGLRIIPEIIMDGMKRGDLFFFCNPNNPTGYYMSKDDVKKIVEYAEDMDVLVVLDEAYTDFVEKDFDSTELMSSNLIILRSLTKSYTIPGVRIGYAVSSPENISTMRRVKSPWTVDIFAQKIGVAVIGDDEFLKESRKKIFRDKEKIERRIGVHSDANFYLLDVGNAKVVREELIERGILVRDCTSFGLPSYIRFSVRKNEENEMLMEALRC
jgi:histidinol-phosphate aminotransferase